jgi:hypothetical protein
MDLKNLEAKRFLDWSILGCDAMTMGEWFRMSLSLKRVIRLKNPKDKNTTILQKVANHPPTQCYRTEGLNLQHHHCEKFRSHKLFSFT